MLTTIIIIVLCGLFIYRLVQLLRLIITVDFWIGLIAVYVFFSTFTYGSFSRTTLMYSTGYLGFWVGLVVFVGYLYFIMCFLDKLIVAGRKLPRSFVTGGGQTACYVITVLATIVSCFFARGIEEFLFIALGAFALFLIKKFNFIRIPIFFSVNVLLLGFMAWRIEALVAGNGGFGGDSVDGQYIGGAGGADLQFYDGSSVYITDAGEMLNPDTMCHIDGYYNSDGDYINSGYEGSYTTEAANGGGFDFFNGESNLFSNLTDKASNFFDTNCYYDANFTLDAINAGSLADIKTFADSPASSLMSIARFDSANPAMSFFDTNGMQVLSIDETGQVFDNLNQQIGAIFQDPALSNTNHFVNLQGEEILTMRNNGMDTQIFTGNQILGTLKHNPNGPETLFGPDGRIITYTNNGSLFVGKKSVPMGSFKNV